MEEFTDDRAKRLLGKEWLSKTDAQTSTPYLIKFTTDPADLSCTVIITDTKSVWAEVLLSAQFARRWRRCNAKPTSSGPLDEAEEESWRKARLELISRTHSLGAFSELSFEVVPTRYSDLAVRIEAESFIWTWETNFVGHRMSADLLSQQLIFPLISVTHIALGGQENVTDMTDGNLEKAIDKTARTARRTPDTYIRNAMAKPRVATSLQRMSAMFGFLQDPLPRIASSAEKPDLSAPDEPLRSGRHDISLRGPASGLDALSRKPLASPPRREMVSPPQIEELSPPQIEDLSPPQIEELSPPQQETPSPPQVSSPPPPAKKAPLPAAEDSETESSTDDEAPPPKKAVAGSGKGKGIALEPSPDTAARRVSLSPSPSPPPSMKARLAASSKPASSSTKPASSTELASSAKPASRAATATASKPASSAKKAAGSKPVKKLRVDSSDSDSSPPPAKRARAVESSSSDDDHPRRGTRQPLRRGGKRF